MKLDYDAIKTLSYWVLVLIGIFAIVFVTILVATTPIQNTNITTTTTTTNHATITGTWSYVQTVTGYTTTQCYMDAKNITGYCWVK